MLQEQWGSGAVNVGTTIGAYVTIIKASIPPLPLKHQKDDGLLVVKALIAS